MKLPKRPLRIPASEWDVFKRVVIKLQRDYVVVVRIRPTQEAIAKMLEARGKKDIEYYRTIGKKGAVTRWGSKEK